MKTKRPSLQSIKIPIILSLTILMSSCYGQENRGDSEGILPKEQAVHQHSATAKKPSNTQISQVVRMMFQDSKGKIWFGTQNGAFVLVDNSLVLIDTIDSELERAGTIKDITEDKDGAIWLGYEGGLSMIKGDTIMNYYESDGLISNDVWCIEAASDGSIWIGTIEGVCRFDEQKFTHFDLPEGKMDSTLGISSTRIVHSIMEDSRGTLWFSTNAGLFSYADDELVDFTDKVGMKTNFVNGTFEDKQGALWIATKDGLYLMEENEAQSITADKIEIGKGIGSIAEDKDGKIWFVCNQHYLYTYDGTELSEVQRPEDNRGPVVFQIYKDQEGRLWFVGYGGAYRWESGRFVHVAKEGPW
jgi:ligand-binding sensor domain-containing protein